MGWRSSLVKALARTEVPYDLTGTYEPEAGKSIPTGTSWAAFWPGSDQFRADPTLNRYTAYAASALAYICINYRAQTLQEPSIMVVEETDDGEEWIDGHELNDLLARPNPDHAMRYMYMLTSIYRDITGAALWYKVRSRGRMVARLYPFSGDDFQIESTDDRIYGRFRIDTRNGPIEAGPEDVIHFPGVDPFNPLGAVSPLDVALTILGVSDEMARASKSALRHAMMPSGVYSVPESLTDDEFESLMGRLVQQHTGRNRGKPLVVTNGATWETISQTVSEILPNELISWIEATVCAIFQLHPSVLGLKVGLEHSSGLARGGMDVAKKMLYDEMAIPRWTADAELLTDNLLREIDDDESHLVRFETDAIPALQEDISEKVEIAAKGQGFLTVNEQRGLLGLQPLPGPEGEVVMAPANLVPLSMVASGGLDLFQPPLDGNGPNGRPVADEDEPEPDDEPAAVAARRRS